MIGEFDKLYTRLVNLVLFFNFKAMSETPRGPEDEDDFYGDANTRYLQFLSRREGAATDLTAKAIQAGLEDVKPFESLIGVVVAMHTTSLGSGPDLEKQIADWFFRFFVNPTSMQAQVKFAQALKEQPPGFTQMAGQILGYWHRLNRTNPKAARCFAYAIALQHPITEAEAREAYGPVEGM